MVSPASVRPLPLTSVGVRARLSRLRPVLVLVRVEVLSGAEVAVPPSGPVPVAVAVLSTDPAFTSAWVMVCRPVQTVESPGARVVAGQVTVPTAASATATAVSVRSPVLIRVKV